MLRARRARRAQSRELAGEKGIPNKSENEEEGLSSGPRSDPRIAYQMSAPRSNPSYTQLRRPIRVTVTSRRAGPVSNTIR